MRSKSRIGEHEQRVLALQALGTCLLRRWLLLLGLFSSRYCLFAVGGPVLNVSTGETKGLRCNALRWMYEDENLQPKYWLCYPATSPLAINTKVRYRCVGDNASRSPHTAAYAGGREPHIPSPVGCGLTTAKQPQETAQTLSLGLSQGNGRSCVKTELQDISEIKQSAAAILRQATLRQVEVRLMQPESTNMSPHGLPEKMAQRRETERCGQHLQAMPQDYAPRIYLQ